MILFSEKQKFLQWWLWILLLGIVAVNAYFLLNQSRNTALILGTLIPIFTIILISSCSLETKISEEGITYQFFPFNLKQKTIAWSDIEKAFVRKYNPIGEYGGWGYRLGIFGKGRALNISGNRGLQLVLKNGRRLLIGTRKPEEMEQALIKLAEQNIFNFNAS